MRTITGRFVRPFDGQPAAHGVLRLELVAEEGELYELSPIGDGAEQYRVPVTDEMRRGRRAEWRSWMSEQEIAVAEAAEFRPQYLIPPVQEVFLDAQGCIPAGTQVLGNDEFTGNTTYRAAVDVPRDSCPGRDTNCFREEIRIAGDAPVDLHDAVLREPEPEVPAPTARELELAANAAIVRDGTARFGKKNRIGFYVGTIGCPTSNAESVTVPALEQGVFGVMAFQLPRPAEINSVSVLVDAPLKGTVFVAIYDASGRKHCETGIDVSQVGPASGVFPAAVNLSEGDYFFAWASDLTRDAQLRRLGALDQLNLMNASGAPLMGTARPAPGRRFPETLGRITAGGVEPILAFLKG